MSKFGELPGCTHNDEICFVGIEPKFIVSVSQPEISVRQFPICLRKRSVFAVDKDMYT